MSTTPTIMHNTCNFQAVEPALASLPFPPTQVAEKNKTYAKLLTRDYCGMVSELSAITLYVNNQIRLSEEYCNVAQTVAAISMAEMIHLQMLGELICLLGGKLTYKAHYEKERLLWTPDYLNLKKKPQDMILDSIQSEKDAIAQYQQHIEAIKDPNVTAVLSRIIRDEEYHIILFNAMLDALPTTNAAKEETPVAAEKPDEMEQPA